MSRGTLGGHEGAGERINLHVVSRIIPRSIRHGNTPSASVGCENTRGRLFENARARYRSTADGTDPTESTQGDWVNLISKMGVF